MPQATQRVTVEEAREHLDSLTERARTGESFRLVVDGEVVAELVPPGRGRVGSMRGTIEVVGDDLAPTSDEWPGLR